MKSVYLIGISLAILWAAAYLKTPDAASDIQTKIKDNKNEMIEKVMEKL
jgi:hypothetical protein